MCFGHGHVDKGRLIRVAIEAPDYDAVPESKERPMRELDFETCKRCIDDYNQGTYRGKRNVDLDRTGYRLFAHASGASDLTEIVELVRFIGEDYGGAQARFLDGGYLPESERIARALLPSLHDYITLARGQAPLVDCVPARKALARLAAPFNASKFWIVWASKFLHFLVPRTFAIIDSRAESALGFRRVGDHVRFYEDFSARVREVLLRNARVIQLLCDYDPEHAPALKVIDKVLYEEGAPSLTRSSRATKKQVRQHTTSVAAVAPASTPDSFAKVVDGTMIHAWITNIASHAERARSGDRFELCVGKEHEGLFPDHKERFELVVAGLAWTVQIGKRDGVRHLYVLTECTAPDQRSTKITDLLRSVGLGPGNKPILKHVGRDRFELLPDTKHPQPNDAETV